MPRRKADPVVPFTSSLCLCIEGGTLDRPFALDVRECQGDECVLVSSCSPWLNRALWRVSRSDDAKLVQDFTDEVIKQLRDEPEENNPAAKAAGAIATGPGALGLSDDEPSSNSEDAEAERKKAAKRRRKHKPARQHVGTDWTTVSVDEREFMARATKQNRAIFVPADEKHITIVLNILQRRVEDGIPIKSQTRQYKSESGNDKVLGKDDTSKLTWLFSKHAWEIQWQDGDGALHKSYQDYIVPRAHHCGRLYDKVEYETIRRQIGDRARRSWNEKDCSTRARYGVPSCMEVRDDL